MEHARLWIAGHQLPYRLRTGDRRHSRLATSNDAHHDALLAIALGMHRYSTPVGANVDVTKHPNHELRRPGRAQTPGSPSRQRRHQPRQHTTRETHPSGCRWDPESPDDDMLVRKVEPICRLRGLACKVQTTTFAETPNRAPPFDCLHLERRVQVTKRPLERGPAVPIAYPELYENVHPGGAGPPPTHQARNDAARGPVSIVERVVRMGVRLATGSESAAPDATLRATSAAQQSLPASCS